MFVAHRSITRQPSFRLAALGAVAVAGLALTACSGSSSSTGSSSSGATSPAPSVSASSGSSPSSPTSGSSAGSPLPSATATDAPGVLRGSATGDPDIDVLVNVVYANGSVTPNPGTVAVTKGQKVKVHVTSDKTQDIDVAGHPDQSADVDPGDPEGVDFTADRAGSFAVTLRQAKVTLVTLVVS